MLIVNNETDTINIRIGLFVCVSFMLACEFGVLTVAFMKIASIIEGDSTRTARIIAMAYVNVGLGGIWLLWMQQYVVCRGLLTGRAGIIIWNGKKCVCIPRKETKGVRLFGNYVEFKIQGKRRLISIVGLSAEQSGELLRLLTGVSRKDNRGRKFYPMIENTSEKDPGGN